MVSQQMLSLVSMATDSLTESESLKGCMAPNGGVASTYSQQFVFRCTPAECFGLRNRWSRQSLCVCPWSLMPVYILYLQLRFIGFSPHSVPTEKHRVSIIDISAYTTAQHAHIRYVSTIKTCRFHIQCCAEKQQNVNCR